MAKENQRQTDSHSSISTTDGYDRSLWSLALSSLPEEDQQIFKDTNTTPDAAAVLNDIVLALEKQRDRCKRHKWATISIGGKELVIRDSCAKMAEHVTKFLAVVDVVASFDPVHVALPWAGVRLLLQLTSNGFQTFSAIIEGLEKATRLIAQCEILETLAARHFSSWSDVRENMEDEIVGLYTAVLNFLCKAKKHHDGSGLKRALNLISRQSLQDSVKEMTVAEGRVSMAKGLLDSEKMDQVHDDIAKMTLTVNSTDYSLTNLTKRLETALDGLQKPLAMITDEISDLHNALKESERSELLLWLSTVQAQHHYRESLENVFPQSGEWLLKDPRFMTWRDSNNSETFWLYGIPGCGKTKLAATVIQHLHQTSGGVSQPAPIAHFFCSRSPAEAERNDSREILRSLSRQLSIIPGTTSLRRPSVDVYQGRRQEMSYAGERPRALTAAECVDLMSEIGRRTPFMIVVDALDECHSSQRGVLLEALGKIRRRCRNAVKVFVSSRHEEDILAYLREGKVLEVTSSENGKDLERFIKTGAQDFVKKWSTVHDEPTEVLQKLEEEIIKILTEGAKGMFLWATLQLQAISDMQRIKDADSILQALNALPSTLGKSYELLYMRVQSLGETPKRVAIHSLHWLLSAERQLSVAEFLAAVSKSVDNSFKISPRSILDYCCNLVVIDNHSNTFRLAHLSVREFLEATHGFSPDVSNTIIAQRCIGTYLWGECTDDDLLDYATQHWSTHVESLGGSSQRETLKSSVVEFFTEEEHLEDWLEYLEKLKLGKEPGWSNTRERKLEACFSSPPSAIFAISCFGLIEVLESTELMKTLDFNQLNKHSTSGLYLAARWGHTEVVRILLRWGADVNAPGHQYGTALKAAAFGGHGSIVEILLEQGASASASVSGEYSSPLHAALANDHEHVAKALMDFGLQLDTDTQFSDALETASFKGNISIVDRLLRGEVGIFTSNVDPDPLQLALFCGKVRQATRLLHDYDDINQETGYFGNALAAAIASRKLASVQLVIDAGAKLNICGRYGLPLRAAVLVNHVEIVRYLLAKGANPNIEDTKLGDPLQAAASSGNLNMMILLLSHNASVNGFGGHFGNALQAACFHGHGQAVKLLIKNGAHLKRAFNDPSKFQGRFSDSLQAAVYGGRDEIVELLLEAGASLNPKRHDLMCRRMSWGPRIPLPGPRAGTGELDIPLKLGPLEVAARQGSVTLVRDLLMRGAWIESADASNDSWEFDNGSGYTALQIAAFWGHLPVVNCLLDHGADIDAVRQTLGTALQAALEASHLNIAEVLLSRGANINRHWMMFGTCLQVFCERGNIEAVEFLLDRGADIEDSGGENGNALQVASGAGQINIVRILLEKGADVKAPGKNLGDALQAASRAGSSEILDLLKIASAGTA